MWTKRAAQLEDGSGWHYVQLWKNGGFPIGFCLAHESPHATEVEARECYTAYLLSNLVLDAQLGSWTDCGAPECDAPTRAAAQVRGDFGLVPLCPAHLNRETAIPLLHLDKPAGDSFGS